MKRLAILGLALFVSTTQTGSAEVVLGKAAAAPDYTEGKYPPSSFGAAPVHPLKRGGSRGPAGLVFHDEKPMSKGKSKAVHYRPAALVPYGQKGVQEVALIASELGYFPKTFFVTRDIPVRLFVTGASKKTLCLMMEQFNVKKQLKSNSIEEIQFVPSSPGKYEFKCPINGLKGTMIVRELASK